MGKTIVIKESVLQEIHDELEMTEYKFNSNIKHFLHDLLVDPVNAQPSDVLKMHGFNRSRLMRYFFNNDMLRKDERILDKDEDGNPKTATMKTKYKVPKKNFDRKLKRMWIKMFEKNVPVNEDGDCMGATTCDASSGQFVQPLFGGVQRREFNEETTTSTVGDIAYDAPFMQYSDDEAFKRKNGEGGSVSVNNA